MKGPSLKERSGRHSGMREAARLTQMHEGNGALAAGGQHKASGSTEFATERRNR